MVILQCCSHASKIINRNNLCIDQLVLLIFEGKALTLSDCNCLLQSFLDLQFPNGQLTYVAGEGISASGFLPLFGGLLQAHGKFPGETRVSFSCKVSNSNLCSLY